ncbi:MAG: 30S ribosomal protein S7 [Candidatus Woesearchaeota archaeon]
MEIKALGRWSVSGIVVEDPGLKRYISLNPTIFPKTGARYAGKRFYKSKTFIVERLINRMMVTGHKAKKHFITSGRFGGKAATITKIVTNALALVEQRLKENPVKVLVKVIENAAPREEIVAIEYGGARYPKAVDCAPQRRIDVALKNIVQGAYWKAFNNKKRIAEALADELIAAYRLDAKSNAIAKKYELERQADSAR